VFAIEGRTILKATRALSTINQAKLGSLQYQGLSVPQTNK
jgi:hypothetical protein